MTYIDSAYGSVVLDDLRRGAVEAVNHLGDVAWSHVVRLSNGKSFKASARIVLLLYATITEEQLELPYDDDLYKGHQAPGTVG